MRYATRTYVAATGIKDQRYHVNSSPIHCSHSFFSLLLFARAAARSGINWDFNSIITLLSLLRRRSSSPEPLALKCVAPLLFLSSWSQL